MTTPKSLTIEDWLRIVRDAGADDDNNGAEDWTYSDKKIDEAKLAISKIVSDILDAGIVVWTDEEPLQKQRERAKQYGLGGEYE